MPDKKLPAVPETILKRRKRQAESRAKRAKATLLAKRERRVKRVEVFKRAEKYAKEYRWVILWCTLYLIQIFIDVKFG